MKADWRRDWGDAGALAALAPELDPPFEIVAPRGIAMPLLFNAPHSGRVYPAHFVAAAQLDAVTLRRSEDAFVDELFLSAPLLGAPLLRAHFPRAYLDVNREPYELDPRMFDERLPGFANTRSTRVSSGLGTIPRLVGDGLVIYDRPLPLEEAAARIAALYIPYHAALKRLIDAMLRRWGQALIIDCHSMPSQLIGPRAEKIEADIVLGDRFGASAEAGVIELMAKDLSARGYRVERNKPYAGGFITEHYGRPHNGVHVVQIEINRALYMDEHRIEKTGGFEPLAGDLGGLCETLAAAVAARFSRDLAAE